MNSLLMLADNFICITWHPYSLLPFGSSSIPWKPLEPYARPIALHIDTGDNGQLQILQAWPGCNQTPQSLGHLLPLLERPRAERTAICLKYGRDSPLIHCSTSCVADYPKRPRGGISFPSLQSTTQGLLGLACADRFWDQPTFDAWQPSPRSIDEVGEWKKRKQFLFVCGLGR